MAAPAPCDALTGLGAAEARARLAAEGFNELPAEHGRPMWRIALGVMREPMFFLLVAAAVVYALIGDRGGAVLLLVFATLAVAIAIVQQGRSERALDALRDLSSPRALVVRDGQRREQQQQQCFGDLADHSIDHRRGQQQEEHRLAHHAEGDAPQRPPVFGR